MPGIPYAGKGYVNIRVDPNLLQKILQLVAFGVMLGSTLIVGSGERLGAALPAGSGEMLAPGTSGGVGVASGEEPEPMPRMMR